MAKKEILGLPEKEFFAPGHRACTGCGPAIAMRLATKAAGENTIVIGVTGCMEVVSTPFPQTAWALPWVHGAFETGASIASGVDAALKAAGRRKGTNVMAISGDGGMFDIGFGALSGALERRQDFLTLCYDNEAYMNCLATDSLIMTKAGLKKITDIKKGELVYAFDTETHKLVLRRCIGVFNNGRKKTYELKTLHHNIKATGNHPFLVLKHNGRGKKHEFIWKTLDKLMRGDEIIALKHLDEGSSYTFNPTKQSKKGDYKVNKINHAKIPAKSSPELMKLLGIYVGDGWTRVNKAEVGFAVPENNRARKLLLELIEKVFEAKITLSKNEVHIRSINVAMYIDSLGFGKGAKNKIIPPWIFTLSTLEKEEFIEGLMLADGYKNGKSWRYVSASNDLLRTLRLLLQTINRRVGKIHWQEAKAGRYTVYRPLLKDTKYGYICFSRKRKWNTKKYRSQFRYQNFLVENKYFDIEKVREIKSISVEQTLDLQVEDAHNFIANGIVVHNTGIQRSGATPQYAWTTTTPVGTVEHGKRQTKKPLPFIVAAHGAPYVATASIGEELDFVAKVRKALSIRGPTFIHILTPCIPGWKTDPKDTVNLGELAVETGIQPLYEIKNGVLTFTKKIAKRKPVKEYLKPQGRFKHLTDKHIEDVQKFVDRNYEWLLSLEKKGQIFPSD